MARARVLINVFLLGVVYPHQSLNRLDHTLRISNQISISLLGSEAVLKLPQEVLTDISRIRALQCAAQLLKIAR